jgi:hypothetical protein
MAEIELVEQWLDDHDDVEVLCFYIQGHPSMDFSGSGSELYTGYYDFSSARVEDNGIYEVTLRESGIGCSIVVAEEKTDMFGQTGYVDDFPEHYWAHYYTHYGDGGWDNLEINERILKAVNQKRNEKLDSIDFMDMQDYLEKNHPESVSELEVADGIQDHFLILTFNPKLGVKGFIKLVNEFVKEYIDY